MNNQMTLALDPGVTIHPSLKACVAAGIYQRGVVAIAGKLDASPSHLSESLSGNDRRKFDVDDLEAYIAACIGKSKPYVSRLQNGKRAIPSRLVGPLCAATGSNLLRQFLTLQAALSAVDDVQRLAAMLRSTAA